MTETRERPQQETLQTPAAPISRRDALAEQPPLVTVLCASLVNNTETTTDALEFNALQRVRQVFFALAQDEAQRYEGALQFFGADSVLVVFNVTPTCKDHAQRAVRAAMALQQRLRDHRVAPEAEQTMNKAVRMGLHTGPMSMEHLPDAQRQPSSVHRAGILVRRFTHSYRVHDAR